MAGNNLIIVESPAKVKTIKKYLGSNYTVDASQGHVRDLPKSRMGVKVESTIDVLERNRFAPLCLKEIHHKGYQLLFSDALTAFFV